MSKATLKNEKNVISTFKKLPSEGQQEVIDFIEFLKQKNKIQKPNIKKIMALKGALKDDKGLERRIKKIRKELNKWRNIEYV